MLNDEKLQELLHTTDISDMPNTLKASVRELIDEVYRLRKSLKEETNNLVDALLKIKKYREEHEEAEQILGKALGCPPYPVHNGLDFRKSPAEKTDEPDSDWVCIGDDTLLSLCDTIVDRMKSLEGECNWLAEKHWLHCPSTAQEEECHALHRENCTKCWLDTAKKAVQNVDN